MGVDWHQFAGRDTHFENADSLVLKH
jgi:hypothetical protein